MDKMKNTLVLLIILILLTGNSIAQWSYLGLHNKKINSLNIEGDYLYAATDSGLFKKDMTTVDTLWNLIGFQNIRVNDIYIRNSSIIYASTAITGIGNDTITLFVSNTGGNTWSPLWGEYDWSALSYLEADDIEGIANNSDTIIMMSGGIRKSVNGGMSFVNNSTQGGRFLSISKSNPDHMWTGGEGVLLDPYLIQTTDCGNNWNFNDSLYQIIVGDNACLSAAIHPLNHNIVYVGMEGQIAKTIDNGSNWSVIFPSSYYMKVVEISPANSSIIYASGGTFGGQNITLFVSNNEGVTWDTLQQNISAEVDVLSGAVKSQSGTDLIYLGTRINGVYKFENSSVGYIETNLFVENTIVYPNPFSQTTVLKFDNPNGQNHSLLIFNLHGELVKTITEITTGEIRIERKYLTSGLYLFQLRNEIQIIATGKLIAE